MSAEEWARLGAINRKFRNDHDKRMVAADASRAITKLTMRQKRERLMRFAERYVESFCGADGSRLYYEITEGEFAREAGLSPAQFEKYVRLERRRRGLPLRPTHNRREGHNVNESAETREENMVQARWDLGDNKAG